MNKDITTKPKEPKEAKTANLAAVVAENAVSSLAKQRENLNLFIKTQLKEGVDYGVIPGTPKPTLFKAGAEKLANIFQLGSKIAKSETRIEHDKRFILCTYTIELFHLPTDKTLAQCEGSTNSLERRYAKQDPFGILNTLQKMAQKRAFVGAVIQACNASDFFTQDLEDMDVGTKKDLGIGHAEPVTASAPAGASAATLDDTDGETLIKWGKYKGKTVFEAAEDDKFLSYCDWITQQSEGRSDKQRFLEDVQSWKRALESAAEKLDEKGKPSSEHARVA